MKALGLLGGGGSAAVQEQRQAALNDLFSNTSVYEAMLSDYYQQYAEKAKLMASVQVTPF